jgi:hypothetical protein
MNQEHFQDETLFDRLADGELTEVERRQLLASLDDRPDGWRRCALAFLEMQSWRGDLGQFIRESVSAPADHKLATPASTNHDPFRQGLAWLAIAASVMLAFTLGLMQNGSEPRVANIAPDSDEQLVSVAPSAQSKTHAARTDDALTLWVRDNHGHTRPVRVPLVDAAALDQQYGLSFQSAIPNDTRERLQQRGYDMQSKRRYAPLWLENGRPMIVPVEDTKIVPVGHNIY